MMSLHPNTVYRMVRDGELEAHRVRGVLRVHLDSVAQYQARNRVMPWGTKPAPKKVRPTARHSGHVSAMNELRATGIL